MVPEALLSCEGMVKRFPVAGRGTLTAVNDVSLRIEEGEAVALVGESGSGKTTIGRMILHTLAPTDGRIVFRGQDIAQLDERHFKPLRRSIQAVFQDPYGSLNPRRRVRDIVLEPVRALSGLSGAAAAARVAEVVERVGLPTSMVDRYPHELGGGQQQRVSIARAITADPELIVLDEPTSALDPIAREEILALLADLRRDLGLAYLFITHDLTIIEHVADRVAIMYLGKIVEEGPAGRVFAWPLHPYTRALIQAVPFPDLERAHRVIALRGEIPSPIDLPPGCLFASRCPLALPSCCDAHPPLEEEAEGHRVACYRTDLTSRAAPDEALSETAAGGRIP